ncbi:copper resistance protein [Enterobacteriaceae bacterium H11S18]|uniref:copper resistance protein n=1 Tax=Dryocola clanedunensis TaxID=2925396 RepID=UPI0022F0AD1B|nr:copper resistance protein [Dryocola clanedunensis]MCT4712233.1 copper resistance protein [Dryocola clanedunensis]
MFKRKHLAKWFLVLACLVMVVCTAQRMAGLHALQMKAAANITLSQPDTSSVDDAAPVSPCELSAKSLLSAPPVLFEGALFALSLLLTLLIPAQTTRSSVAPLRAFSSPTLRVHLRFCVFRE